MGVGRGDVVRRGDGKGECHRVCKRQDTHTHTHTDSEEMPPPLSIPIYPRELRVQPLPLMEVETRECDMGGLGAKREVAVSGRSMSIDSGRFSGKSIP